MIQKADSQRTPLASLLKNPELLSHKGLIAGEWIESDKKFPVYEPSSGEILHHCSDFGHDDFIRAVDCAYVGYQEFSHATNPKERATVLRRWYELIQANSEDLAIILSSENGKVISEGRGEVNLSAAYVRWFAEEAVRSYGDTIPSSFPNTTVLTYHEPVGVCGIITPWNFPAAMITRKIAPAFAAGCAVVIKPPSETPFSAIAFAQLALQAGVPPAILHVVPTKDRQASLELATNPKVKKLSFTGSTGVGKKLTQLAAGTMKRVSMELGGNAPFIVFDDANLDIAVQGAIISKFRASGQTCVCTNRLLVHQNIVDKFAEKLVGEVRKMKLGYALDDGVTHGPLVNAAAVAKVAAQVEDAVRKGGVVNIGGKAPAHLDGFFFEPTVITNAHTDMDVAHDETFGPLAAIFAFRDEQHAIELANDTEFGLAGYFYSENVNRVLRVARRLDIGMIGVNTGLMTAVETPFGGVKESGVGREGSKYGLAEYQNLKAVTIGNINL